MTVDLYQLQLCHRLPGPVVDSECPARHNVLQPCSHRSCVEQHTGCPAPCVESWRLFLPCRGWARQESPLKWSSGHPQAEVHFHILLVQRETKLMKYWNSMKGQNNITWWLVLVFCLPSLVQALDSDRTTYSGFKSSIKRKLKAGAPVASSPVVTRWQQRHAGGLAAVPRRALSSELCALRSAPLVGARGRTPGQAGDKRTFLSWGCHHEGTSEISRSRQLGQGVLLCSPCPSGQEL